MDEVACEPYGDSSAGARTTRSCIDISGRIVEPHHRSQCIVSETRSQALVAQALRVRHDGRQEPVDAAQYVIRPARPGSRNAGAPCKAD